MVTRVKMCGMTRVEDALLAVELGVAAIGLIFYQKSPRAISAEQAQQIVMELPPFVTSVGVFLDASHQQITEVLEQVPLDLLQFHGHESPEECRRYGKPYIKAIPMSADADLVTACKTYYDAKGLLLDTSWKGQVGGTGQVFDWTRVPKHLPKPIILAGGLTPANVAEAIAQVQPYAVDVTTGIEAAKGIKDPEKMRAFMQATSYKQTI